MEQSRITEAVLGPQQTGDHGFRESSTDTVVKFQLTGLSSPGTVAKMSNDEIEPGKTELDSMKSQGARE